MATSTDEEIFPKSEGCTREHAEKERQLRLNNGAVSCELTEDEENFYLISVWNTV